MDIGPELDRIIPDVNVEISKRNGITKKTRIANAKAKIANENDAAVDSESASMYYDPTSLL